MPVTREFPLLFTRRRRFKVVSADAIRVIDTLAAPANYGSNDYGGLFARCGWTHIAPEDTFATGELVFQLGARVTEGGEFHFICYGPPYDCYVAGVYFKIFNIGQEAPAPNPCSDGPVWVMTGNTPAETADNLAGAITLCTVFNAAIYTIPATPDFPVERTGIHLVAKFPGPAFNFFFYDGNEYGGSLIGPGITSGGGYTWVSNGPDSKFKVIVRGAAIGQYSYPPLLGPLGIHTSGIVFGETFLLPGQGIQFDITFFTLGTAGSAGPYSFQLYAATNLIQHPDKYCLWVTEDGFALFEQLSGNLTPEEMNRSTSIYVNTPQILEELKGHAPDPAIVGYAAFAAGHGDQIFRQDWYNGGFGGLTVTALNGNATVIVSDSSAYPRHLQFEWHDQVTLAGYASQPITMGAVLAMGIGKHGDVGIVGTLRDVAVSSGGVFISGPHSIGPGVAGGTVADHNFVGLGSQPGAKGGGFGFFAQTRASIMICVPRTGLIWDPFEVYDGGDVVDYGGHVWEAFLPQTGTPPTDACSAPCDWIKLR